jgi:hypothetical protein
MNQDHYDNLITRVREHCQQIIDDAMRIAPDCFEKVGRMPQPYYDPASMASLPYTLLGLAHRGNETIDWNDFPRHAFISMRKDAQGQVNLAYPPASEQQLNETEQQLGFNLPLLLRLLYAQVANGGFGPGYGIYGVIGGFGGQEDISDRHIVHQYRSAVNLAEAHLQLRRDGWRALTQQALDALREDGITIDPKIWESVPEPTPEQRATPEWRASLPPPWPEQLLPLCNHGCGIITYVYADTGQVWQGMHDPYVQVTDSLEQWLERWLRGEPLQLM